MPENRMNIGDFHGLVLFQLFQLFRINSTNFGPKQTPKTPKAVYLTVSSLQPKPPEDIDPFQATPTR